MPMTRPKTHAEVDTRDDSRCPFVRVVEDVFSDRAKCRDGAPPLVELLDRSGAVVAVVIRKPNTATSVISVLASIIGTIVVMGFAFTWLATLRIRVLDIFAFIMLLPVPIVTFMGLRRFTRPLAEFRIYSDRSQERELFRAIETKSWSSERNIEIQTRVVIPRHHE